MIHRSMPYNGIIILVTISYLMFIIQFVLCLKAERIAIKLIPVYISILVIITSVVLYAGVFRTAGFNSEQRIYALFFIIAGIVALVGNALAWIAYFFSLEIQR